MMKAIRLSLLAATAVAGSCVLSLHAQDRPPLAVMIRGAEHNLAADPQNPALMFDLAHLRAAAGQREAALSLLEQVAAKKTGIDPEGSGFDRLKDDQGYKAILARIRRDNPPVTSGTVAFTIPEADLIPEGIAYDSASGRFFLGSIHKHKIVAWGRNGRVTDFVSSSRDGLNVPLGLRVDSRRRLLWAACQFQTRAGVAAYSLSTGRMERQVLLDEGRHEPNDLVVTRAGDVYVTDSRSNELYRLPANGTKLERVIDSTQIDRVNGIALAPDESRVFVAAWPSIVSVDLRSMKVTPLRHSPGIVTGGVDGLYFHKGSLVAVQNVLHPGRVMRFKLSEDLTAVESADVLQAYNPHFDIPTTGAVGNGSIYVIANSQLEKLDGDKLRVPLAEMKPTTILRVQLRW